MRRHLIFEMEGNLPDALADDDEGPPPEAEDKEDSRLMDRRTWKEETSINWILAVEVPTRAMLEVRLRASDVIGSLNRNRETPSSSAAEVLSSPSPTPIRSTSLGACPPRGSKALECCCWFCCCCRKRTLLLLEDGAFCGPKLAVLFLTRLNMSMRNSVLPPGNEFAAGVDEDAAPDRAAIAEEEEVATRRNLAQSSTHISATGAGKLNVLSSVRVRNDQCLTVPSCEADQRVICEGKELGPAEEEEDEADPGCRCKEVTERVWSLKIA